MRDDFAVMICSHGRAKTLTTFDALRECGYTGKIFIIIDDEDNQIDEYRDRFENVHIFCKQKYYEAADGVIEGKQKCILYARNACYDIAAENDLTFFCEIDDDISAFYFRYIAEEKAKQTKIKSLDEVFEELLHFYEHKKTSVLGFMTQGDYIGGISSKAFRQGISRTVSNVFIMKTDRRIDFIASMNEDTCSALVYGQRGELFMSVNGIMQSSEEIGNNTLGNGMTEFYEKLGSFSRTFIAVICRPDCVKAEAAKGKFRIRVNWNNSVPMIINERWKK